MSPTPTVDLYAGSPFEAESTRLSPTPDRFPQYFEKLKALDTTPQDWPEEDIAGIQAPTLVVVGDRTW
jgi:hypothetical protein